MGEIRCTLERKVKPASERCITHEYELVLCSSSDRLAMMRNGTRMPSTVHTLAVHSVL